MDTQLARVVHLGLCFTVLFSDDFTLSFMQKTITSSIRDDKPEYQVDGYTTLAVTYFVYGLALWLAPSFLAVTGPRICMILGSVAYVLHPVSFLLENVWVTYGVLIICGLGGSILWVAHGNYMIRLSDPDTMSRNIAVFWILYSLALIPGNVYASVELQGKDRVDRWTRQSLLIVLAGLGVAATLLLSMLRPVPAEQGPTAHRPASLANTWAVFTHSDMLTLTFTFIFTGFQQAFGNGVLGPSVGFTKAFGSQAKFLIPITGLCYGVGEITGGLGQVWASRALTKYPGWRCWVLGTGLSVQLTAFLGLALALPPDCVYGETDSHPLLPPWVGKPIVLGAGLLLGAGDCILNSQIYPLLALLMPDRSSHACALYKFTKSMAMVVFFVSSSLVSLWWLLSALTVAAVSALVSFLLVEARTRTPAPLNPAKTPSS